MEQRDGSDAAPATTSSTDDSPPTPRPLESAAETPRPSATEAPTSRTVDVSTSTSMSDIDPCAPTPRPQHLEAESHQPPSKKFKSDDTGDLNDDDRNYPETPVLAESAAVEVSAGSYGETREEVDLNDVPKTPVASVHRQTSSSPSDLSSSSRGRDTSMSPVTPFVPEVPPAPPSTPASDHPTTNALSGRFDGLSTPLPYAAVKNADELEHQQQLAEGAVTPAPTKPDRPPRPNQQSLTDDFSEWAVGDRYQLLRMLGRGSYGEVAQALDLYQGRPDAYVAIKRIQKQ